MWHQLQFSLILSPSLFSQKSTSICNLQIAKLSKTGHVFNRETSKLSRNFCPAEICIGKKSFWLESSWKLNDGFSFLQSWCLLLNKSPLPSLGYPVIWGNGLIITLCLSEMSKAVTKASVNIWQIQFFLNFCTSGWRRTVGIFQFFPMRGSLWIPQINLYGERVQTSPILVPLQYPSLYLQEDWNFFPLCCFSI